MSAWPSPPPGEEALFATLRELCEEGMAISARIERQRDDGFHSFIPADYSAVLRLLLSLRESGGSFLEMGSGTGVIAIMADLLGFEAFGIEIAPELVREAQWLADRYGSGALFEAGSFIPQGYEWVSDSGDRRWGTVGIGEPAYAALGRELSDFEWVYAYPWPGESDVLRDVMERFGAPGAKLLLHGRFAGD